MKDFRKAVWAGQQQSFLFRLAYWFSIESIDTVITFPPVEVSRA